MQKISLPRPCARQADCNNATNCIPGKLDTGTERIIIKDSAFGAMQKQEAAYAQRRDASCGLVRNDHELDA